MPHLLLVDDDPHLGQIVSILCKRGGHQLTHARDAVEAWTILHSGNRPSDAVSGAGERLIDLTLLDVHLPGESGVGLCQRIRAEPALANLPVALFTHQDLVEDIAAGWEAGADFVVAKDLVTNHDQWQQRLQEILSGPEGQREEASDEFKARDRQLVGQPGFCLLPWLEGDSSGWQIVDGRLQISGTSLREWLDAVNELLYHPASHLSGVQVVAAVLRRAVHRALVADPSAAAWLTVRQGRINLESLPSVSPTVRQGTLRELILSLAEQVWRLLGGQASETTRRALARLAPPADS